MAPVEVAELGPRRAPAHRVGAEPAAQRIQGRVEPALPVGGRRGEEIELGRVLQVVDTDPEQTDRLAGLTGGGEQRDRRRR